MHAVTFKDYLILSFFVRLGLNKETDSNRSFVERQESRFQGEDIERKFLMAFGDCRVIESDRHI